MTVSIFPSLFFSLIVSFLHFPFLSFSFFLLFFLQWDFIGFFVWKLQRFRFFRIWFRIDLVGYKHVWFSLPPSSHRPILFDSIHREQFEYECEWLEEDSRFYSFSESFIGSKFNRFVTSCDLKPTELPSSTIFATSCSIQLFWCSVRWFHIWLLLDDHIHPKDWDFAETCFLFSSLAFS